MVLKWKVKHTNQIKHTNSIVLISTGLCLLVINIVYMHEIILSCYGVYYTKVAVYISWKLLKHCKYDNTHCIYNNVTIIYIKQFMTFTHSFTIDSICNMFIQGSYIYIVNCSILGIQQEYNILFIIIDRWLFIVR